MLVGFERADSGTIRIGERLVEGPGVFVAPDRRRIGYVLQEGSLFPDMTVAANVTFGLAGGERRGGKAESLLEAVGLGGLGRRYPHQLSGGQQQRVALARAPAIEPTVVLLDEPFASLDAHLRASVRADVQEIFRRAGTTAVLVTHDQDEALWWPTGSRPSGTARSPSTPHPTSCTAGRSTPSWPASSEMPTCSTAAPSGGVVDTLLGGLRLDPAVAAAEGKVTVLVRPEQIDLVPDEGGITAQVI